MADWQASCHPDILTVLAYWESKRRGRVMPGRDDIDPTELVKYLPYISIIDVVEDPRRFVYRLVGTMEVEVRGFDPTGKAVADGFLPPAQRRRSRTISGSATAGRRSTSRTHSRRSIAGSTKPISSSRSRMTARPSARSWSSPSTATSTTGDRARPSGVIPAQQIHSKATEGDDLMLPLAEHRGMVR
ncbi:MAG TPA: PAS domain-containing protein [Dongiaceae bacterium]|nr:PAS domain-containing protein [Dongiaceae bacterium]